MIQHERNNSIDLLRILSALAVVLMHSNYTLLANYIGYGGGSVHDSSYVVFVAINIITRFSVPCFVMISGAFLISENNTDFHLFYKKSFKGVFIPFIVALLLQFVLEVVINIITNNNIAIKSDIKGIINGAYNNMWFMYMLAGLYLLTPLVIRLKWSLNDKQYIFLAFSLFVWSIISQATSRYKVSYTMGIVFAFLGYYIIGDIIRMYSKQIKALKYSAPILSIIAFLSVFITFVFRYTLNHNIARYAFEAYTAFFSPTIAIFSVSVFALFSICEINTSVVSISKLTFGVYLFHTCIMKFLHAATDGFSIPAIIYVLILFIGVTVISFMVSFVFDKVIKRVRK